MSNAQQVSRAGGGGRRWVAALAAGAMLSVAEPGAAAGAPRQSALHPLLDVPYVSQTPELCGGAAVAMVLRYWGERGVFAQDFASLVGAGDGGIPTIALASAVRARGWQALVVPAAAEAARARIQSEIDRGRPLIALIEVAPRTYHYVVIVGGTDQAVVLHDPARAPFRVLPWTEFDRAWAATERWLMLVLPPGGAGAREAAVPALPAIRGVSVDAAPTACRALVDRSVDMALSGDREGAERGLVAATGLCPKDPAPWRELAGLRFSESRWPEARDLALSAVRLAPDDLYAWQLVATSRYLIGDTQGALGAWNHLGEPRLDAVEIHGADRTRHPVVVRAVGLQPRQVLTPDAFGLALRRLRDLPVASNAQMKYEPIPAGFTSASGVQTRIDGGLAKVDVFIDERPVVPRGWFVLAILGVRALVLDEVRVDVAGSLGAGELASAAWRWASGRPRVALSLALPSPRWFPGIVSLDGSWERQSYDATPASPAATVVRDTRRRVGLRIQDWYTHWLRWQAGAALDRLPAGPFDEVGRGARDHLAVESALDARFAGDRLALVASGGWWAPFAGGDRFATGGLLAAWRSTDAATRPLWSAVTEISIASRAAPLALWQGAGTGPGRAGLLRAHPLLDEGVLNGLAFGRHLAHGSLEYAQPLGRALAGGLSIAGFVDAAQAWHRVNGLSASGLFVDAGVGIRVRAPGSGGAIRIDLARGLRGGGTTLSAGWGAAWPR